MASHSRLSTAVIAICLVSLTACSLPFGGSPRDIRVTSVSDVDYKGQTQIDFVDHPPHPSKIISRIDFTTSTDLLALSASKDYNVTFAVGPCTKAGVQDSIRHYGKIYWGKLLINDSTKAPPEYAAAMAKGPPFAYQAYVERLAANADQGSLCFALAGGNMLGGKLKSNVAVIPLGLTHE